MLKLREAAAKPRKISEEFDSKLKKYHSGSDEEDETPQPHYHFAFQLLMDTISKSRDKYPLPRSYFNIYAPDDTANCVIMFHDIGPGAQVHHFIPPGLQTHGHCSETFSYGSEKYGFVSFDCHQVAQMFLHKFNGLEIPGTDLTYKLSWAPFWCHDFGFYGEPMEESDDNGAPEKQAANVPMGGSDDDDDVCEALVPEDDTVSKIEESFKCFYNELHEKAHKEKKAFWTWPLAEENYYPEYCDDGCTRLLYLWHVDPSIKKQQLSDLFGCFGKCTVALFGNTGSGIVEFDDRKSAHDAYVKVRRYKFEKLARIFDCTWGFKNEDTLEIGCSYALEEVESGRYMKVEYFHECAYFGSTCPRKEEFLQTEFVAKL